MPIVIDPDKTHSFEYEGTTFEVKALTGRDVLMFSATIGSIEENADGIYTVLHSALKSWEGVEGPDGNPLPCEPKYIDALPVNVAVKVFEFIASLSGLSGEDQGN